MERDPFRFAWRASPWLHVALIGLALAVGLPTLWITLDAVRAVVQLAAGDGETAFLRLAIDLPDRIRTTPLVLSQGLTLTRSSLPVVGGLGALALISLVVAGWLAAAALSQRAGRRAAAAVTDRFLDGIAAAPISASEEARSIATLAGDILGRERDALGLLVLVPVLVGIGLATLVVHLATTRLEMAAACLLGLCLHSIAANWRLEAEAGREAADRLAAAGLVRSISDLARHLPAVTAHGTGGSERGRIATQVAPDVEAAATLDARAAFASSAVIGAMLVGPVGVLWAAGIRPRTIAPGAVASAIVAAGIAVALFSAYLGWRRRQERLRPLFAEIARGLAGLQSRRRETAMLALPASGDLIADNVTTSAATGRLVQASLVCRLPDHVALLGGPESGARTFAALLGGQLPAAAGRLTFGGVDLLGADPRERARRIAFAGGQAYLFAGSLRANLLYGSREGEGERRLEQAVSTAGLDDLVRRRGLSGVIDPRREPELAAAVVGARSTIRDRLAAQDLSDLVEPFEAGRYNPHATLGENILFGVALGDTFREDRLPSQPFVKSLLDAEGLTKPLAAMGASIARATFEMFAELPTDSLVGRFALMSAAEREQFEGILDRRDDGRRGTGAGRDGEKLLGLALRYCERRHRLGLLSDDLQDRLVKVRAAFSGGIPKSLEPSIEFLHPDRLCAAASVRDNLLFGRIAQDQADAERRVSHTIRVVLDQTGLGRELSRVGLAARLDPVDPGMSVAEIAAVDLVRCLVRDPDTLVIEHALDPLPSEQALALLERLATAQAGRGLIVVVPDLVQDRVKRLLPRAFLFESGRASAVAPVMESEAIARSVAD